jgi:hypothetical protein
MFLKNVHRGISPRILPEAAEPGREGLRIPRTRPLVEPDFDAKRGLKGSSFVHRNTELTTLVHWRSRAGVRKNAVNPDLSVSFRGSAEK